nr:uncharacterized mitochondrial protein AtMg00810-like [Tanacetum cinerariifolium]
MRPFGCPVTIFNTLDPLGKFDGKANEGFLVGYSVSSKAFRVFNSRPRIVQETLHINFLKNQPNVVGSGPKWLFNIDTLTQSMNYQPVVAGNQPNHHAGIQGTFDAGTVVKEADFAQQYVLLPLWSTGSQNPQNSDANTAFDDKENASVRDLSDEFEEFFVNSTNRVNAASAPVIVVGTNSSNNTNSFNAAGPYDNAVSLNFEIDDEEDVGAKADFSNLETSITVSPIPTTRVHKDHPVTQIIGDLSLAPQIRSMTRMVKEHDGLTQINDEDFHTCMFACFLSQKEPKRIHQALKDTIWIEAMQEKFLQFKMQKVWVLVDLLEGFKDPNYPYKVYKVVKALYGLHQAPRAWPDIMFAVFACARFQVTAKASHLHAVKMIFRYLKGKPHLGLWYPKDSTFNSVAYSDSDYAGASLDRKSKTKGYQFLGCRLISWQCKKQSVVATSSTKAKYVAAASCCA